MRKVRFPAVACFFLLCFACGNGTLAEDEESPVDRSAVQNWIDLLEPGSWQEDPGEWVRAASVSLDPDDATKLVWEEGEQVWVNGPDGKTVDLHSSAEHGDVELHIEFMVSKGSNSGVYLQSRYEIQIFDSWEVAEPQYSDCGGIYQRWRDGKGFEGHPPRINASRPPGEWQSFDIFFRAPRFDSTGSKTENARFLKVVHNGELVHENVEVTGPTRAASFEDESATGPLMIQGDHGPVAFRNVRIRKLDVEMEEP